MFLCKGHGVVPAVPPQISGALLALQALYLGRRAPFPQAGRMMSWRSQRAQASPRDHTDVDEGSEHPKSWQQTQDFPHGSIRLTI